MFSRKLSSPLGPIGLLPHLFVVMSDSKRTRIKELLRSGLIHVNGVSVTRHDSPLRLEDQIEVRDERASPRRSLPFEVLYEDALLLVLHKPNGLLTVGNKHEKSRTVEALVNRALANTRERCYIVQRLDLYTSGVLLLAKSEKAQKQIMDNWSAAQKVYHALVEGVPSPREQTLTHYLKEDERLIVHASKEASKQSIKATLSYRVIAVRDGHALLQVDLKTGKKNQIRTQLAAIGHPIAGDAKYGATTNPIRRLCLHASSLTIAHPKSGERVTFQAPMPQGMNLGAAV